MYKAITNRPTNPLPKIIFDKAKTLSNIFRFVIGFNNNPSKIRGTKDITKIYPNIA